MQRRVMLHSNQQFLSLHYWKGAAQTCKKSEWLKGCIRLHHRWYPALPFFFFCGEKAVKDSLLYLCIFSIPPTRTLTVKACHGAQQNKSYWHTEGHAKLLNWLFQRSSFSSAMDTTHNTQRSLDKNRLGQAYFHHKLTQHLLLDHSHHTSKTTTYLVTLMHLCSCTPY